MGFILTRILWGLERRPSASQLPDTALMLQAWNAITLLSLVGSTHVLQQKNRSILMSEKIIFCPYTLTLTSVTERENKRMWGDSRGWGALLKMPHDAPPPCPPPWFGCLTWDNLPRERIFGNECSAACCEWDPAATPNPKWRHLKLNKILSPINTSLPLGSIVLP